jgi:hypothetical protein
MAPCTAKTSFACKHVDFLKKLRRCGRTNKAQLISGCDRGQVNAVCECVDNILRGKVKPTTRQKERLKKHFTVLANLADPKVNWEDKQKYLSTQQGGSILASVLGIALPALIEFLASQTRRRK